jgi:hypothetical protein
MSVLEIHRQSREFHATSAFPRTNRWIPRQLYSRPSPKSGGINRSDRLAEPPTRVPSDDTSIHGSMVDSPLMPSFHDEFGHYTRFAVHEFLFPRRSKEEILYSCGQFKSQKGEHLAGRCARLERECLTCPSLQTFKLICPALQLFALLGLSRGISPGLAIFPY